MKVVRFTNIFNLKNNEDVVWFALEVEITSKNISHFLTFNFGAWESYEVGYDKIQRASSESFYQEFSSFEKQIIFTFTNRNFLQLSNFSSNFFNEFEAYPSCIIFIIIIKKNEYPNLELDSCRNFLSLEKLIRKFGENWLYRCFRVLD